MFEMLESTEIEDFIKDYYRTVLLDVRTEEQWGAEGKPDGEKMGLKTHFLSVCFSDGTVHSNFVEEFTKLNIQKYNAILIISPGGIRGFTAAELLAKEDYHCIIILGGFLGEGDCPGWKTAGLPCKFR